VARATGFEAQKEALGEAATAVVAVANAVSEGHIAVVPEVLVTGGGGSFEGLAATLMRTLGGVGGNGSGNGSARASNATAAALEEPAVPGDAPPVDEVVADTDVTSAEAAADVSPNVRPPTGSE
jgi:hypothetical protein